MYGAMEGGGEREPVEDVIDLEMVAIILYPKENLKSIEKLKKKQLLFTREITQEKSMQGTLKKIAANHSK